MEKQKTSYGFDILKPECIKEVHDEIVSNFINFFRWECYKIIDSVNINSGIDPSVYLIWAPISVMKPYLINREIPNDWWLAMAQPSIRTHGIKTLLDPNIDIKWGSFFTWLATLSNFNKKEDSLLKLISFLVIRLWISSHDIKINISSEDEDLCKLLDLIDKNIVVNFDSKPINYYRHKYWLWDIVGRNFNIALREKWTENYNDIWNFIIIENGSDKYWVEVALWASTMMKEMYDLSHTLETSVIEYVYSWNWENIKHKFQDSIVSAILLYRINIRANSSNTKWRILKTYISWIKFYREQLWISVLELQKIIQQYEKLEYWNISDFTEYICNFI